MTIQKPRLTAVILCATLSFQAAVPGRAETTEKLESEIQREIEIKEFPGTPLPSVFVKFKDDGALAGAVVRVEVGRWCGLFQGGEGSWTFATGTDGVATITGLLRNGDRTSTCRVDARAAWGGAVATLTLMVDNSAWPAYVPPAPTRTEPEPSPTPEPTPSASTPSNNQPASGGGGVNWGKVLIYGIIIWAIIASQQPKQAGAFSASTIGNAPPRAALAFSIPIGQRHALPGRDQR